MDIWPQFYLNAFTGFCRYVLLNDQTFQKISASGSYSVDLSILSLTCLNSCSGKGTCNNGMIKIYLSIFLKREVVSKLFFSKFDGIGHLSFLEYFENFCEKSF